MVAEKVVREFAHLRYRKDSIRDYVPEKFTAYQRKLDIPTQPYFFGIDNDCSVSQVWLVSKSFSLFAFINMSSTDTCIFWLIWSKRSQLLQQFISFFYRVFGKTIVFFTKQQPYGNDILLKAGLLLFNFVGGTYWRLNCSLTNHQSGHGVSLSRLSNVFWICVALRSKFIEKLYSTKAMWWHDINKVLTCPFRLKIKQW